MLKAINGVHQGGGCCSTTIPSGPRRPGSFTDQNALLTQAREPAEDERGLAVLDLLETGYQKRGTGTNMASLDTHLRLFDLLARARRFVTVHRLSPTTTKGSSTPGAAAPTATPTGIWAPSLVGCRCEGRAGQRPGLVRRGARPSGTVNSLDLMVDGVVPMGSVVGALGDVTRPCSSPARRCRPGRRPSSSGASVDGNASRPHAPRHDVRHRYDREPPEPARSP